MTESLSIDVNIARRYVNLLTGQHDPKLFWVCKPESADAKAASSSVHSVHGTLSEVKRDLVRLNAEGYAIFVCIVEMSGDTRRTEDAVRPYCYFADFDGNADKCNWVVYPSFIVQTSDENHLHAYWRVDGDIPVDSFKAVGLALSEGLADPAALLPTQLARVPGFIHHKGTPKQVKIIEVNELVYKLDDVLFCKDKTYPIVRDACIEILNAPKGESHSTLLRASMRVASYHVEGRIKASLDFVRNLILEAADQRRPDENDDSKRIIFGAWQAAQARAVHDDKPIVGKSLIADDKFVIDADADRCDQVKEVLDVMQHGQFFVQDAGTNLAKLIFSPDYRVGYAMDVEKLATELSKFITFEKTSLKGAVRRFSPSVQFCRAVLAEKSWPKVKPLKGFAPHPLMRRDGSVYGTVGYDAQTQYIISQRADIDVEIGDDAAVDALLYLFDFVGDFQWDDNASFSTWLCLLFSVLFRHLYSGPTPLLIMEANDRGAGKTLLAGLVDVIHRGIPAFTTIAVSRDEDAFVKEVLSLLAMGKTMAVLDNISFGLGNAKFDALLTSPTFEGRLLGTNTLGTYENKTVWAATGNNIRLSADMVRRCFVARILRREERHAFARPNIITAALDERAKLLSAACTIMASFLDAVDQGMVQPPSHLASYSEAADSWNNIIRGAVCWVMGKADILDGDPITRLGRATTANIEDEGFVQLMSALESKNYRRVSSQNILNIAKDDADIAAAIMAFVGKPFTAVSAVTMGRHLSTWTDKQRGEYLLTKDGTTWCISKKD